MSGHIIVWDVVSGDAVSRLQDGNQPVQQLSWLEPGLEKTDHLLLAVHPPNHAVLWNTQTGARVWKKSYPETILGFDFDPFDHQKIVFRCPDCLLFVNDFHPVKCPQREGKRFFVMGGKSASPGKGTGETGQRQVNGSS